jgi:microcystin-dependent protein
MVDFKSDLLDTDNAYAYIPTGSILTKAGAYSEYSLQSFVDIGLIPCDGRLLNGSTGQPYSNLWSVIGLKYGGTGQSSFQVPNLIDLKRVVYGVANSAQLGTKTTGSHAHGTFQSGSTPTVNVVTNADIFTHTHSAVFNTGNQSSAHDNVHGAAAFNVASPAPNSGLRGKADGTSQAASVGHTHGTWTIRPGTSGGMIINANHAHNNPTINTNASTTAEGQHIHTFTPSTDATMSNSSFFPPKYDVLFFIKA